MSRSFVPLALCATLAIAACGDDDVSGPDLLTRDQVGGVYTMTELSFDPQGSLPSQDILAVLEQAQVPTLNLSPTVNSFQLVFTDPATSLVETVDGTYTLTSTQVRLAFSAGDETFGELLFPETPRFVFAENGETTLTLDTDAGVSLERLRELVPALEDEPLTDPVPGQLRVTFQRD